MRISEEELGPEGMANYEVFINFDAIPSHAVAEANEEAFYAVLYQLDSTGHRVVKATPGPHPELGLFRYTYPTYLRYGHVIIAERKP